jgi:predicted deacylase
MTIHSKIYPVRTEKLDLGPVTINIPVAQLLGSMAGPSLLVTAGVDGDEYAGIRAAYEIIREFAHRPFRGTLTVIPIVNISGFYAETGKNPLDGAYPKHVFPGKSGGTPTQRLCHWLSAYAFRAQLWLDMHGGAQSERLVPFVWSWACGNRSVDTIVGRIIRTVPSQYACFEPQVLAKTKLLATHGCGYLLAESGELGMADAASVARHVRWMRNAASVLGMTDGNMKKREKTIFTHIHEYSARHSGLWIPSYTKPRVFAYGETLGDIWRENGTLLQTVQITHPGMMLWGKTGMRVKTGDILAGFGQAPLPQGLMETRLRP